MPAEASRQPLLDSVAQPARLRMVRHLGEHDRASLTELAAAAGVHANTARVHLAQLEQAGVVERISVEARGPGRPATRYRLASDRTLGGDGFRGMAELLAAALARSGASQAELEELGRSWGRYLAGRPGAPDDAAAGLPTALEALGFRAEVAGSELHLADCPCPLVAPDDPGLVCGITDAVVDGILEASAAGLRVRSVVHDPVARRCRATLRT